MKKKMILAGGMLLAVLAGIGIGVLAGQHSYNPSATYAGSTSEIYQNAIEPEAWSWFEENGILCASELHRTYPVTVSSRNENVDVVGSAILTDVQFFDSDEEHEAMEGYEWVKASFETVFTSRHSWAYNGSLISLVSDFYDPHTNENENGEYTVSYNGVVYDRCCYDLSDIASGGSEYATQIITLNAYARIPKGYDGLVVGLFSPAAAEDISNAFENQEFDILRTEGTYFHITHEMKDDNVVVLRSSLPAMPDTEINIEDIVRCSEGYEIGFAGLRKVKELAEAEPDMIWDNVPVYKDDPSYADTKLESTLKLEDSGVYEVVAAARKGDVVKTVDLSIVVDSEPPKLEAAGAFPISRTGEVLLFDRNTVYGVDNFYEERDCIVTAAYGFDEMYADIINDAVKDNYVLVYMALDPSGNMALQPFVVDRSYVDQNYGDGKSTEVQTELQEQSSQEQPSQEQSSQGQQPQEQQQQEQPSVQAPADGSFSESMAREALEIINSYRASIGSGPLAWSDDLYEPAKIRAQELVTLFSHTRPGGGNFASMLEGKGYTAIGENIAWGQRSATEVFQGWYSSEGHRANMGDTDYTKGAIACWYQNGTYYWVNLFAN